MEPQDLIWIAMVLVCVWTFIPRHLRRAMRSGLEPAVIVLAETVRDGTRLAGKALTHISYKILIGAVPMSSSANMDEDEDGPVSAVSLPETNRETAETPRRVAETGNELFTLGEIEASARLVASGKVGLTDAVRIGADAVSGEKYQKRSREIKAAVARMQDRYPRRTPEQQALRKELNIK